MMARKEGAKEGRERRAGGCVGALAGGRAGRLAGRPAGGCKAGGSPESWSSGAEQNPALCDKSPQERRKRVAGSYSRPAPYSRPAGRREVIPALGLRGRSRTPPKGGPGSGPGGGPTRRRDPSESIFPARLTGPALPGPPSPARLTRPALPGPPFRARLTRPALPGPPYPGPPFPARLTRRAFLGAPFPARLTRPALPGPPFSARLSRPASSGPPFSARLFRPAFPRRLTGPPGPLTPAPSCAQRAHGWRRAVRSLRSLCLREPVAQAHTRPGRRVDLRPE